MRRVTHIIITQVFFGHDCDLYCCRSTVEVGDLEAFGGVTLKCRVFGKIGARRHFLRGRPFISLELLEGKTTLYNAATKQIKASEAIDRSTGW